MADTGERSPQAHSGFTAQGANAIDSNESTKYLAEKFGIPEKLIRSKEEMQMVMRQMQEAMQMQQAQQQGQMEPDAGQETPPS